MHSQVDEFIVTAQKWQAEMGRLRGVLLDCQLVEEFKWRAPCYTFQKSNIAIIQVFKEYCALGFFKGALLADPNAILVAPGEHSQAMRQVRFTAVRQIIELDPVLKAYIDQAIAVEKAGLSVNFKKTAEYIVPVEFQKKLDEDESLKAAFDALTPGRQRGYILYFSAPKQSTTRLSRVEKSIQQILAGKGLND